MTCRFARVIHLGSTAALSQQGPESTLEQHPAEPDWRGGVVPDQKAGADWVSGDIELVTESEATLGSGLASTTTGPPRSLARQAVTRTGRRASERDTPHDRTCWCRDRQQLKSSRRLQLVRVLGRRPAAAAMELRVVSAALNNGMEEQNGWRCGVPDRRDGSTLAGGGIVGRFGAFTDDQLQCVGV